MNFLRRISNAFSILQGFDYKSLIYMLVVSSGALYITKFKVYSPWEYGALILQPVFYIPIRIWIDHGVNVAVFPIVMIVVYNLATRALRLDFMYFVDQLKTQAQVISDNAYLQLTEQQEKNKIVDEKNRALEIELAAYKIVEEKEKNKKKKR